MGKIRNSAELAVTPERKAALEIAEAGLAAIDTKAVIRKWVKNEHGTLSIGEKMISQKEYKRLFVIGIGKCALDAGIVLEEILGDAITEGIVLDVRGGHLARMKAYAGTHPFPTEANVNATAEIIGLLARCTAEDLVLFIVSGGGSTLLCQPRNLTYVEEAKLLKYLFEVSAPIEEINVLRKHLSLARGGHLAAYAYPARVISLIFSDVPGDDVQFISSGPTVKDTTTVRKAQSIVKKYKIEKHLGLKLELLENPKDDKYFRKVNNTVVVSNQIALAAMQREAMHRGFKADIVTHTLRGEARKVGVDIIKRTHKLSPHSIALYGGETTVTVKGNGLGGRNQELALGAMEKITRGELVLSVASDGHDNGDYAGALCDIMTKEKAERMGLKADDFLKKNDSSRFFEQMDDMLVTGGTGSNVSDLVIALKV